MKLLKTSNDVGKFYSTEINGGVRSLRNGDCLDILSTYMDNSIDLILTDPPYNLGNFSRTRNRHIHSMNRSNFVLDGWDNASEEEFNSMMDKFFAIASQKLKIGGSMLMFCSFLNIGNLVKIAQKNKFYYKTSGVWHKTNPMPRNMNLHFVSSTEAWLYFVNQAKTGYFNNEEKVIHDFIETPVVSMSERKYGKHPTQKPVKLMKHFINILSNEGMSICDPFMGIGTTAIACNSFPRRNFYGIELNEDYFKIAVKRLKESV